MARVDLKLRLRAAVHELNCWECRVTWRSWLQRLAGISAGYSPKVKSGGRAATDA